MTCTHLHVGKSCLDLCSGEGVLTEWKREPETVRWCFGCRARGLHEWVLYGGQAYYDPHWSLECPTCHQDRTLFPGMSRARDE